jgi:hypothetical protein
VQVRLAETWLQKLTDEKDFTVSLGDQYQLHHFKLKIEPGLIFIRAEIVDKPGSVINFACLPRWDADDQKLLLDETTFNTKSKNLLLKSAGWVASKFMQEKIDKKIEEQINNLYKTNLEKLLSQPLSIPIKGHGMVTVTANSLFIEKIGFAEGSIEMEVLVNGIFKVALNE